MFYNAENGVVQVDNVPMEYIRFGSGCKNLIMLPGLGDGLRSVKGTAPLMALMYRDFAKEYTVYMFSRKTSLPLGCSTRDMAADLKKAMDILGIDRADLMGVSMGGMIAQHFAADYPERLGKLVLVVTIARQNPTITGAVSKWIKLAEQGDHRALMESNLRLIYSDKYYSINAWLIPAIGALTKPKSYERFFRQAEACLRHDSCSQLPKIKAPTLIIGGEKDKTVGGEASRELHRGIENSVLRMYPKGYHGLYEEEKDFNFFVLNFLKYKK